MNKVTKSILCLVLCIPLVVAIIFSMGNDTVKPNIKNELVKVSVSSSVGKNYDFIDADTIEFYNSVIERSVKLSTSQVPENSVSFDVTFSGSDNEKNYTFFMNSLDTSTCVYKNIDGEMFLLTNDDAYQLLLRNEFSSAYPESKISDIYFSLNDKYVSPVSYDFKFKKVNGEFTSDVLENSEKPRQRVSLLNDMLFTLNFDNNPDYILLTCKKDGQLVYSGEPSGLSTAVSYTQDTILDATVEAKWYEAEGASSFGQAKYEFELLYDIPASFKLVNKSLKQGEFTIIRVTNGNDDEIITASSDMMEKEMLVFSNDGEKYIYIPIKPDATVGEHTININAFSGPATLKFTVKKANFDTESANYRAEVIVMNTTKAKDDFNVLLDNLLEKGSTEMLWDGKFVNPVNDGKTVCNFGTTLNITGVESNLVKGMYISKEQGSDVVASNNGVVLYAGENDYAGNMVVIDHGLGLYSYYFNLGEIKCKEGDFVTKGSFIAKIGTSGVTAFNNTIYYANAINGCFINPATQFKYGVSF